MSTEAKHSLTVDGVGPVEVTATDTGRGHPFLVLHGGAGPQSVSGFADLLVTTHGARVITPTHPGFGATPRPDRLASIAALARVYVALLDEMDVEGVTVVGNSIGGWIAAEMALLGSPRISSVILVDAVGIEVEGHPIADFFSLTLDQVAEFSYHDPERFRIDPTTMAEAQRTVMAGNRASLAIYGGRSMIDPSLRGRLANITVPTLVVWETAIASSTRSAVAPTQPPSRARPSSSSPRPATCHRSRHPNSSWRPCGTSPPRTLDATLAPTGQ